ncbi:MAG: hypothetical protein ACKVS7_10100 [Gemmatimonadaceae bacterium]
MPRMQKSFVVGLMLLAASTTACEDGTPFQSSRFPQVAEVGNSLAYGIWTPSGTDTCTQATHDSYSVIGPDGLRYPTWHPPVDPTTGCTFGHEHGRDPRGSNLYRKVGPIPFGYANQHLVASGFGAHRQEDHVGHKVEWENSMMMHIGETGNATLAISCDILTKLHQGTHSPDAFTNNLHEVVYHIDCTDGTEFSATLLTPIGPAGELSVSCDRETKVAAGTPTPANSPDGGGQRAVPETACINEHVLRTDGRNPHFDSALRESWEVSGRLRRADGHTLASFNPYYQVMDPSRYFAPGAERSMARPIDLCFNALARDRDRCRGVTDSVRWDDPRSPFKGVRRFVDVNGNFIRNKSGPNLWYTDPLGQRGSPQPFPGSIMQWVGSRDNSGLDLRGDLMGRNRSYDGPGVRAPN